MEENIKNKMCEQLEEQISEIVDEGVQADNLNMLGKLVDIKKDIANMEYWENKEEVMNMRNYRGDYGRGNYGREEYGARGRGRYSARGGRGRTYRGEEMIEEMAEHYGTYMDGSTYGGAESDKAFDYMLQAAEDFMTHLMDESDSPEKMEKIRRVAKRISEMR